MFRYRLKLLMKPGSGNLAPHFLKLQALLEKRRSTLERKLNRLDPELSWCQACEDE